VGAELLAKLLKNALLLGLGILIAISVYQANEVEARLVALQESVRDLERKVQEAGSHAASSGEATRRGGGTDAAPPLPAPDDPRTLVYWATPDNLLADPKDEPGPPPDAPRGGILRYVTSSNPRSLNRLVYNEAELADRICAPVYEYLAPRSLADPDRYVPGLANRVVESEDRRELTCYIRKGMTWHAPYLTDEERAGPLRWLAAMPPQEVTAHDVKFTIDVVRDPLSEAGALKSYLEDLESVEALDDYTVRFRWRIASYYNRNNTLFMVMIYPKFIYEREQSGSVMAPEQIAPSFPQHWFNLKMCGTGPFRFAGFVPNQYILLERNDRWWNPRKPALGGIRLAIESDYDVMLAMFKKGDLDIFPAQPNQYRAEVLENGDVAKLVERGEATVKKWERFGYYYVGWNFRHPALRERAVRRAFAHLFPKDRVIRDVYFGLAIPHDGPVHHWESHYAKDLESFPYDPKRAAAILQEAGWGLNSRGVREKVVNGERLELVIRMLHATQGGLGRDLVQLYSRSAQDAGVVFEPQAREWSVMTKMLEDKEFDACVLGWANTWDGDQTQVWHSSSALSAKGSNHVSYVKPEVDAAIDGLKREFDPLRRKALWETFQRTIVADQPYCFTLIRIDSWFVSNRLGNQYFAKIRPHDWFIPWYVKRP